MGLIGKTAVLSAIRGERERQNMRQLNREEIMDLLESTDDLDLTEIANEYWRSKGRKTCVCLTENFETEYHGSFSDFWKLLMHSEFCTDNTYCLYYNNGSPTTDYLASSDSAYTLIKHDACVMNDICDWLFEDDRYMSDGVFSEIWYAEWEDDD